jgi:hypothetical protein
MSDELVAATKTESSHGIRRLHGAAQASRNDFVSLPNDTEIRESIGKIIGLAKCAIPHPTEMAQKQNRCCRSHWV